MWLVYKHNREVKVAEVRGILGHNMYEIGSHKYFTRNPWEFMKLQCGKVLCQYKEDVPKAREIVLDSIKARPNLKNNIYLNLEEIELLESCLSKYFYDIDGPTPQVVINCSKKLTAALVKEREDGNN